MIELRLADWAGWRRRRPDLADDLSAWNAEPESAAMQSAIDALPTPLRETILQCYLQAGDMVEHTARLGCPQWTINRRIGRAHMILQGHFAEVRAFESIAAERVSMMKRLTDGPPSKR